MKKLFVYGVVAMAIMATSCEKESDPNGDAGIVDKPVTEADTVFSEITVEQHKANIEEEGVAMLDKIQLMEQEPAIDANYSMATLMDESTPFKNAGISAEQLKSAIAFAPVYASAKINETGVEGILKSTLINPAEEPETIQEMFDELVGIYEWNPNIYEWDYTDTGDDIVLKFPAVEGGTSNNASYTVTYVGYTDPNPLQDVEDGYMGDIPQNVAATLKVDGSEVSKFTANAVYDSEGIPTSIDVTFSMGEFVWNANLTNTVNAAFDAEASFKHANNTILKFAFGVAGDWTEANIEDNFAITYYAEWYDEELGYWVSGEIDESELDNFDYTWSEVEFDVHKVIKEGNASFQAMNMKIVGAIDAEKLGDAIEAIPEGLYDNDEDEAVAKEIEAMNEHVSLSLRYGDSNEIIALIEAYPISEEYSYEEYYYDGEWHDTPRTITETDYWIGMRFVFADGSKVDMETYLDEGFDDLIQELEDWADSLEETYGK
ncbi:MAG: hypothetical protein PF517_07805 [Salinivirgaceae bacterium]|jgi:hypothetical protein|nr:hypothetical protein [Salinivirgaceae bacterium]